MFLDWFDASKANAFGISIAEFLAKRIPPESIPAADKKSVKKVTEVMEKIQAQTLRFRTEEKLNVYKKAKLANAFQWKLIDLGYDKEIVKNLAEELAKSL